MFDLFHSKVPKVATRTALLWEMLCDSEFHSKNKDLCRKVLLLNILNPWLGKFKVL